MRLPFSGSVNAFLPGAIAVLLALALIAPAANAGHWTIHYSAVDKYAGATVEDDGAILKAPGNPLHGRANNVVAPGASPGDGTIFLDARAANWIGYTTAGSAGVELSPSAFAGDLTDRDDLLLSGLHHTSAWYGWWQDLNTDGRIDDRHDTACGSTRCPDDEFAWRGIMSGDAPGVLQFTVPRPSNTTFVSGLGDATLYWVTPLADQTNPTNAEQSWSGAVTRNVDGPLLTTIQTVTLASDLRAPGSEFVYDFDAPGARWDVDRYESLNADVEALYHSAIDESRSVDDSAADGVLEIYRAVVFEAIAVAAPVVAIGVELLEMGAIELAVFAIFLPFSESSAPSGREPTTAEDDFEGRAIWGGVGDLRGSGNTFPGYADEFALWIDNRARTVPCFSAYARADAITTEVRHQVTCSRGDTDLLGKQTTNERGSGSLLGFEMIPLLWRDANGDGAVGALCDPADPEAFDSEANACREWGVYGHDTFGNEVAHVCDVSHAKGSAITLTPMGGPWPGVVVVRNQQDASRVVFDRDWEIVTDDSPIVLRWEDECPDTRTLRARDHVFFPAGGSDVPIRVETAARIVGFVDASRGILIDSQRVTDVDILPANL